MSNQKRTPKARKDDLVVQDQGEETLIYDTQNHHAHCLNRLAALVWRNCDGRHNLAELAALAHKQLGAPDDTQIIELALQELEQAKLLEGSLTPVAPKRLSRRELAHQLGAGAAAFVMAPLVTSIVTQPALALASPRHGTTTTAGTSTSTTGTKPPVTTANPPPPTTAGATTTDPP